MPAREEEGGREEECDEEGDAEWDEEWDEEERDKGEPFTRVAPASRAHRHAEQRIGQPATTEMGVMSLGFRAAPGAVTVINVLTSVCSSVLVGALDRASRTAATPE
ncbi:hypothetical protein DDQ41_26515 [Streptomyces spongiicola]|uniref:Uncharacterized protein n=1 Tax=Streptomyces spongiicola TaxID=1690221 RepID=A0ABM6VD20_9ACTN|nr:hypothetical protein DDQ41_26515 [Streptomyces spongiicola]